VLETSKIVASNGTVGPRPTATKWMPLFNAPSLPPGSTGPRVTAGGSEATGRAWSLVVGARDIPTDDELDFSVVVGRKRQRILTDGYNAASRDLTDSDNYVMPRCLLKNINIAVSPFIATLVNISF